MGGQSDSDGKSAGFFSRLTRKQNDQEKVLDEKATTKAVDDSSSLSEVRSVEPELHPVSFTSLFRFSTRFELFLDGIGLLAAVAGGAAQPLMTLMFGNITQSFVNFGTLLAQAQAGVPGAQEAIPAAAAKFRHVAARDASYLVFIGVGLFVCTYTYMCIWIYTGEVNAKRIRERYLQSVLRQDIAFFDNVGPGEIATRIQTDTHLVQQGISEKVALSVSFISAFCTGFIMAYIRSWRLALALTTIIPCIGITGGLMNKFVSQYKQYSLQHVADGGTLAEEVISTVRTAQAFGTQKTLAELYDTHIEKSHRLDLKASIWHGGGLAIFFFVLYAAYGLAFSFGTTLILRNQANAGIVVNVFLAILIGSFSMALLAPEMQAITHGRAAASKLFATIDRIPDIDSGSPDGTKPQNVVGEIEFENVTFSYPSRPDVIVTQDLSVKFPAGKTAAIVGASGSGKSTIISLVERFYDPSSGVVRLDGTDIRDLNIKWLRSQIGLVLQEPTLFATTIKQNVAYGLIGTKYQNSPDEEKFTLIREACIKANADGFISKLPLGYDTMVGERGFLLSGGQKQRVAIARAIVSDPKILLLDEATSALDGQSEGVVQDALDKAAAGRTTITIAHRLSTIKDANRIFVMREGAIVEQGSHTELLSNENSTYSKLVEAQRLREHQANGDSDSGTVVSPDDITEAAQKEEPLGRRSTGRSLASEILEKRRTEIHSEKDTSVHGLPYLFVRMGKINSDVWYKYVLGAIFAIMTGMVYPSFGVVYANGIKGFSQPDRHAQRVAGDRVALWLFLIAICSMFSIGLQNYFFAASASNLTAKLRSLNFRAILRQDVEFFDQEENSTGSLTSDLSENPQKVFGLAGVTLGAIVQSISTVIGGSILGLIFVWKLALVAMACMPFLVSAGYIRLRVVVLKDQKNKKAHANSAHLACEAAFHSYRSGADSTSVWSSLLFAFSQGSTFFVISLVFWYGSQLISRQEYPPFHFFVGLMSTTFGAIQSGNVFSFVPDMSSAKGAGSEIIKMLDSVPEIDAESPDGKKPDTEKVKGHLRLENIHFRYPTRPGVRVLRDLSLQVEPGTYIALVGASGSGKSTVIQLIERFYDPLAGHIYLDGQLITELNIQEYRKQMALVSQEPTLYAGSIRFNILLGAIKPHSEITQQEIEDACRKANILDFIIGLPNGFETEVGGKGSQLSGGQKQRIAIARALLRNPKVLLLDEATSALDSASERVVQDALDEAAKGRTTIAIAHRLSTIQNADRIYFIKEGRISESGTHDQLIDRQGDYYEYVQLQALGKK